MPDHPRSTADPVPAAPLDRPDDDVQPMDPAARRKLMAFVALPVVFVLGAVIWLFSAEGAQPAAPAQLADLPRIDGTLSVVEADRLVMTAFEPLDGETEIEFVVPEQYRGNFDLAHLRSHSSVAIPTRIYYLERDGEYVAVYKDDAPVNTGGSDSG